MKASHLACKGCGATYPLEALFACDRCFGPLEVGWDESEPVARDRVERGPRRSGGSPTSCRWRRPSTGSRAGFTPLIKADRLADELGLDHLYLKNDCANPTQSFKDRVVTVAATKAREFGFETLACASTGNLASSVAAAGAAPGWTVHLRPARPGARQDHRLGHLRRDAVRGRRLLRRREPAVLGAGLRLPVGVRQREHAPLLRRGVEDARLETAEQLGWRAPDQVSRRSRRGRST